MIIAYGSDLHLEFGDKFIIEELEKVDADVLILAGDIADTKEWKSVGNSRSTKGNTLKMVLDIASCKFKHTFIVMGNHEHYKGTLQKTKSVIEDVLPENIHVLENEVFEYEGVLFAGCTMWTEMSQDNPVISNEIHFKMNDFKMIRYLKGGSYIKFSPNLALSEFIKSKSFVSNLPKNRNIVLITHHAPHSFSVPIYYKNDNMNGAYASSIIESMLEIGELSHIKIWVHGHIHNKVDYTIDKTNVLCNPRGYQGYEDTAKNFKFEIKTI